MVGTAYRVAVLLEALAFRVKYHTEVFAVPVQNEECTFLYLSLVVGAMPTLHLESLCKNR